MAGVGSGKRRLLLRAFGRRAYFHTCRVSLVTNYIRGTPVVLSNLSNFIGSSPFDSIYDHGSHSKNSTYSADARLPMSIAARTVLVILGV
jgi:hypothetical protein